MRPADFWPFAEEWLCRVCGEPVDTREGVAVVNGGNLAGLAHEDCLIEDEEFSDAPIENVRVQSGLL